MLQEFKTAGRLSRGGFWLRHLTLVPLGLWLAIAVYTTLGDPYDLPVVFALTLALVSTWGRRLHDRGRSAWWLLAALVPVLGALWLIVECALRGAADGASRFGPPPGVRTEYLAVEPRPTRTPNP